MDLCLVSWQKNCWGGTQEVGFDLCRYMAPFVDPVTSYEYLSAEQYMMAGKVCVTGILHALVHWFCLFSYVDDNLLPNMRG